MTETVIKPDQVSSSSYSGGLLTRPITCVFTGGGTGGHVYPALAIADELQKRNPDARIVYIGARGKIEETLVPRRGYPIHLVPARGLPSPLRPLPVLDFFFRTAAGILQSIMLLLRIRPDLVVATGGFASSPTLIALKGLRLLGLSSARCFVHEQNVVPGKVNRLADWIADRIAVSFKASLPYFNRNKGVWTGYPVRREIGAMTRAEARERFGLPEEARVVFAFGGSQGARSINRAVVDALPFLLTRETVHVFHVTGQISAPEYDAVKDSKARLSLLNLTPEQSARYHSLPYTHEIDVFYAASDLIIGRAGAATVTEICVCGRPSVLIPLPYAPGDHQAMNAQTLEKADAARVVYEEIMVENGKIIGAVSGEKLARNILDILDDPERQRIMSEKASRTFDRSALDRIMDEIDRLAGDAYRSANGTAEASEDHTPPRERILVSQISPFQLTRRFSRGRDEDFIRSIGADYLKYRVDGYLKSANWKIRNEGVKLVGALGYPDRLPYLLYLLRDRTPASPLQRLAGGDYRQVGFIRRNSVLSIARLGVYTPEARSVLLELTDDPYYETRAAVCRAFGALADRIGWDTEINAALRRLSRDCSFEVAVEAILALGRLDDASVLDVFRANYLHSSWPIRDATLQALTDLVRRGVLSDPALLRREIEGILITCVGFEPEFPIKKSLNALLAELPPEKL